MNSSIGLHRARAWHVLRDIAHEAEEASISRCPTTNEQMEQPDGHRPHSREASGSDLVRNMAPQAQ
jgi:hypothetical protein